MEGFERFRLVSESEFYYSRRNWRVFSVGNLLGQLSQWTKKNNALPEKIVLPVEEYYWLAEFRKKEVEDLTFLGISVVYMTEDQEIQFLI